MNIPSVLIYINYYFENKDTSFALDFDSKKIEITQNGMTKTYTINDVSESNYHLGIYYKNAIDRAWRIPMLVSDFGYWDLKFKNGDRYYLTNILHDFILDKPFYENTKYRFRMFTYIYKADSKKAISLEESIKNRNDELNKDQTEKRVDRLRHLYRQKSVHELELIIRNDKMYMANAREVAKEILNEKNVG